MIHEIKFKNFLSFRDKTTFSFEAANEKEDVFQTVKMPDGTILMRFAIVFGANASGKSNLLEVFQFLKTFWYKKPARIQETTSVIPFMLDSTSQSQPTEFDLSFYVDGVRYRYWLSLNRKQVLSEKLSYYLSVQPTMLFSRVLNNEQSIISFNEKVVKLSSVVKEKISVECWPNMSFFAARSQVNTAMPAIDKAMNWLYENIMPCVYPSVNMSPFATKTLQENLEAKEYVLKFIKQADFNITNIRTETIKQDIPQELINIMLEDNGIPESEKSRLEKEHSIASTNTFFEHTVITDNGVERYNLPEGYQSAGTLRTFGIETAIYASITKGALLSVDEIESSLHPDILEFVIQEFLLKRGNSQLLVTSHYDPLLSFVDDLIRKDAVWFTEKQKDGNTSLYSLVEFKGLNRLSSIRNAYLNGKFGALPIIHG